MRFKPEAAHGGNAGLHIARQLLEPIKAKYPGLSYADLYALAGTVAIEALGGPKCAFRPGRIDFEESKFTPTPDGRLPDASQGADHVRAIFYRMGFSDQEIVALCGAHALGRCHKVGKHGCFVAALSHTLGPSSRAPGPLRLRGPVDQRAHHVFQ